MSIENIFSSKGNVGLQVLGAQHLNSSPSQAVVPGPCLSHASHTPALQTGLLLLPFSPNLTPMAPSTSPRPQGKEHQPISCFSCGRQLCGHPYSESFSSSSFCCAASALIFLPLKEGALPWSVAKISDYLLPAPSLYLTLPLVSNTSLGLFRIHHCLWDTVCGTTQGTCSPSTYPSPFSLICNWATWPESEHASLPSLPTLGWYSVSTLVPIVLEMLVSPIAEVKIIELINIGKEDKIITFWRGHDCLSRIFKEINLKITRINEFSKVQ